MSGSSPNRSDLALAAILVLAAAAGVYLLLVEFSRYVAVFFCSVLAASALDAIARRLTFGGRVPRGVSMGLVLLGFLGLGFGLGWWLGPELVKQFDALAEQVPRGLDTARRWFGRAPLGERVRDELPDLSAGAAEARAVIAGARRFLGAGATVLADYLIFVVVALFLAADPDRYTRGAIRLLPTRHRKSALEVLSAAGSALRRWLFARVVLMLLIAVLFGTGLFLLDISLAVPLALLAGAFSFVPYVGPALAVIPALAVALLESPMKAVYVAALYLLVQMMESYVVEPLVEGRAVSLPPALIVISQVVSTLWLGPIGVVIATPLLVVSVVALQLLYVRNVLGEEVDVIGN